GSPLATRTTDALLGLAADASQPAALSPRLELYPRGLDATRALKLSAGALGSALTALEFQTQVLARYPEAQRLPDAPALPPIVGALGFHDAGGKYRRKGAAGDSTLGTKTGY